MPRRYYSYIEQFQTLHQTSTVGSWVLGLGFIIVGIYLTISLFSKANKASSNPWGARALEWMSSSPPPHHNFNHTPVVLHNPYDFHKPISEFRLGIDGSDNHHEHTEVAQTQPAEKS